ncbi:MAG TPA: hypothetical protein PLV45_00120 [bacterium]|nr:hypothetical protein [bacterium]
MLKRIILFGLTVVLTGTGLVYAQDVEENMPFPVYPEVTSMGETLCDLWFWRGEPPCFKTTTMHGAYVRYPTRQKARIIADAYLEDGLYSKELLAAFFGTLMVGTYRPEDAAPIGDFWDSGYFGLVKLDYRVEAKNLLWDIVFQRDWAEGRFADQRYKALNVLSRERLITLREYKPLKQYLVDTLAQENLDPLWTNALVRALANFREWNEELLPLFREVYSRAADGEYQTVLQAFLDFEIPDDGAFILDKVLNGNVQQIPDRKLCIRAAYLLDDEYAVTKLEELKNSFKNDEALDPEYKTYVINTLERLAWYGNWEITDTKLTWDDGLDTEKISFRPVKSLDESDDVVDFSMPMQLNDPEEMLPIGTETTYLTNNVTFEVTPETLTLIIYKPETRATHTKEFTLKEGQGRNEGKIYLQFPLTDEGESKGKEKLGWVEIEKIS